jgi:NAD(P)H-dependent flavin oxidoreductase YrpB (nitropropane dioxygenase family)
MVFPTGFTVLFGCRYPLQQAGMGGFTSPDLAIAVSRAGGLGMLSGAIGNEALAAALLRWTQIGHNDGSPRGLSCVRTQRDGR